MANRHRGEIDATFDGRKYTLCLTLGALAELEDAFGADDLLDLTDRFQGGRFRARDLTRIIGAGLRGGGHNLTDEDVSDMRTDGGLTGLARLVTQLLSITFGAGETGDVKPRENPPKKASSNPI